MKIGDAFRIKRSVTSTGAVSKRNNSNKATRSGTVLEISTHIIVVDFGNYRESFQKKELIKDVL